MLNSHITFTLQPSTFTLNQMSSFRSKRLHQVYLETALRQASGTAQDKSSAI